jgi:glycine betaine catabolism A
MLDVSKVPPLEPSCEVTMGFPREYYISRDWFDREMDQVICRQWLYAAHESEIPHSGDFVTREIGDESILVTRDRNDIHALFNVCRHRGARVCQQSRGNARRLVCPYHRWTYGLDGQLIGAPAMPATFEPARYPLVRAHVRSWNGLVFINLSERAPELLDQILESAREPFARFEVARCKVAHAVTYTVNANWKIVLENFVECYHCPSAHPEFCRTFDLTRNPGGLLDSPTHPLMLVDLGEFMLKPGAKSSTLTGKPVCRTCMGSLTESDLPAAVALTFRPTTSVILFGDYGIVHDFQPVSTTETQVRCQWLVSANAEEERDYDVESLIALWDITNRQDWALCEITQNGVRSRRYVPGPISLQQEPALAVLRASYQAMMRGVE